MKADNYGDVTPDVVADPSAPKGGNNNLQTYTASDGTVFTDQNAFATYATTLANNAKSKFDADQAAAAKANQDIADKRDAFALIETTMKTYGFSDSETKELTKFAESQIIDPNIGPQQGLLNLRNQPAYQARFSGNKARIAAGLNALSESDYILQEDAYDEYFKTFGVSDLSTRDLKATLIGNAVSATEVKGRLSLAVDRVKNADPEVMKQLKTYYPTLGDNDLVKYFLNPTQALPDMQRKVTASEIGAAAKQQGFNGSTDALGLADYGVDKAGALQGYQNIATVLPTADKLSSIYGEANINYTQATGESEFLKNNESAALQRKRLASLERAKFSGDAGINAQQGNLANARQVQGKF